MLRPLRLIRKALAALGRRVRSIALKALLIAQLALLFTAVIVVFDALFTAGPDEEGTG